MGSSPERRIEYRLDSEIGPAPLGLGRSPARTEAKSSDKMV
jgi:hypothetical protein